MEREDQTINCHKCSKNISTNNYIIHEAMCKGVRESFVFGKSNNIQQYKKQQQDEEQQFEQYFDNKDNNRYDQQNIRSIFKKNEIGNNSKKLKNSSSIKQQQLQQQKFPCTQCGYMMTMIQLDSHPNQCTSQNVRCRYCKQCFPEILIQQHDNLCEQKIRLQQQRAFQIQRQEEQIQRQRQNNMRNTINQRVGFGFNPVQTNFINQQGQSVRINRQTDQYGNVYQERISQPNQSFGNGFGFILNTLFNGGRRQNQQAQRGSYGFIAPNDIQRILQNSPFQGLIQQLMQRWNININTPGLSQSQIGKLPCIKYCSKQHSRHSTNCSICMTDYEQNDEVMVLPCKHLFNTECIVPWLKNSALCPNCRANVKQNI